MYERQTSHVKQRRADDIELDDVEMHLACRVMSLLTNGARIFALTVAVVDTKVMLCYSDRQNIYFSEQFDILKNPADLVLVVFAISNAYSARLGFLPFVHFQRTNGKISLNGSKIKFPTAHDANYRTVGPLRYRITLSPGRRMFNSEEVIGRGTTVIPIEKLERRMHGVDGPIAGSEPLVCKYAFTRGTIDNGEDNTIRCIRQKLGMKKRTMLKHIVKRICSLSASAEDLRLPRVFLGEDEDMPSRILRVIVMREYQPLVALKCRADFVSVYRDVVAGEYNFSHFPLRTYTYTFP